METLIECCLSFSIVHPHTVISTSTLGGIGFVTSYFCSCWVENHHPTNQHQLDRPTPCEHDMMANRSAKYTIDYTPHPKEKLVTLSWSSSPRVNPVLLFLLLCVMASL